MKTVFIKHLLAAVVLVAVGGVGSAQAAATVFHDEAALRAAAGPVTTYGFETHTLPESTNLASPLLAGQLDNSFGLAYSGLNLFQIVDVASPYVVESFGTDRRRNVWLYVACCAGDPNNVRPEFH